MRRSALWSKTSRQPPPQSLGGEKRAAAGDAAASRTCSDGMAGGRPSRAWERKTASSWGACTRQHVSFMKHGEVTCLTGQQSMEAAASGVYLGRLTSCSQRLPWCGCAQGWRSHGSLGRTPDHKTSVMSNIEAVARGTMLPNSMPDDEHSRCDEAHRRR